MIEKGQVPRRPVAARAAPSDDDEPVKRERGTRQVVLDWSRMVDASPLVESYETAVLQLKEPTLYQVSILEECRRHLEQASSSSSTSLHGVQMDAPPGCGKTFIALCYMLERLQRARVKP